jgi:hypothetical protein
MVDTPKILLTFSAVIYPMVLVASKFDAEWKTKLSIQREE